MITSSSRISIGQLVQETFEADCKVVCKFATALLCAEIARRIEIERGPVMGFLHIATPMIGLWAIEDASKVVRNLTILGQRAIQSQQPIRNCAIFAGSCILASVISSAGAVALVITALESAR